MNRFNIVTRMAFIACLSLAPIFGATSFQYPTMTSVAYNNNSDFLLLATGNLNLAAYVNDREGLPAVGFSILPKDRLSNWWPNAAFDIAVPTTSAWITAINADGSGNKDYMKILSFPEIIDYYNIDPITLVTLLLNNDFYNDSTSIAVGGGDHFSFFYDTQDNLSDRFTLSLKSNNDSSTDTMAVSFHNTGQIIIGGNYATIDGTQTYFSDKDVSKNLTVQTWVVGDIDADYYTAGYDNSYSASVSLSERVVRFPRYRYGSNSVGAIVDGSRPNSAAVIGVESNSTGDKLVFHLFDSSGSEASSHASMYFNVTTIAAAHSAADSAKKFIIDHPEDKNKYLVHAMIESPENRVAYRGKETLTSGYKKVSLPDYVKDFVHEDTGVNIQLTPLHSPAKLAVKSFESGQLLQDGQFQVISNSEEDVTFFWEVTAVRKDVPNLLVEPKKSDIKVHGLPPYRWYESK